MAEENDGSTIMERDLQTTLDVLIIGAGWAGLGAAKKLKEFGINNYRICEACNYVGGRSHTINFGGSTVEEGSAWVHGAVTQNPIWTIAQASSVGTQKVSGSSGVWSSAYGGTTPHKLPDAQEQSLRNLFEDEFLPFQEGRQDSTNQDESLGQTINIFASQQSITGQERRGLDWTLDTGIVQEYAASMNDLSMWWWNKDAAFSGGDAVLKPGANKGYSGMIDYYASTFVGKIDLNCKVTSVDYRNSIAIVSYINGSGQTKSYSAKNVVVTVPLGVLKAGTIQFTPALPRSKLNAISKMGMGLLNKLIMRWSAKATLPWPSNTEWLQKNCARRAARQWTEFFNEQAISGRKILVSFTAGTWATRAEGLTESQATAEAMASLREMFGNVRRIPAPVEVKMARWGKDPLSKGSYSYYKVGSQPSLRTDLRATVSSKIYFAGVATHDKYPATTHGALMSGITAGNAIATKFQRRKMGLRRR
jgi:monoamine oxidase